MQLVLFRHGIAVSHDDPDCPEDDLRPLTPKGIRRTHEAARGLAALEVEPDVILTSPLVRARETALIAAEELGFDAGAVRVTENLRWELPPGRILEEIDGMGAARVLCVGHAPHLDALLAAALGLRAGSISSLGKAGAACVTRHARDAVLDWLLTPRALRRLGA